MTEILELIDKDLKAAMIKMLRWAVMNMFVIREKVESTSEETVP